MKKFFEKFKMRFSYILMVGILGIIFQAVAFFMWGNAKSVLASNLRSTTKANIKIFNNFMMPSYFVIASAVILVGFAIGLILLCRKNQLWTKISAYVLGGSQFLMIVSMVIYIIVMYNCRVKLYATSILSNKNYKGVYIFEQVLLVTKMICMVLTSGAFVSISLSLKKVNDKRFFSRPCTWISIITNGLFVVSVAALGFASIKLNAYQFVSRLFENSKAVSSTYTSTYLNMNGFTYGQLSRLFLLSDEITTSADPGTYSKLLAGDVFAIITILAYALSIIGNLLSLSGSLIDSYDITRDDDRLAM